LHNGNSNQLERQACLPSNTDTVEFCNSSLGPIDLFCYEMPHTGGQGPDGFDEAVWAGYPNRQRRSARAGDTLIGRGGLERGSTQIADAKKRAAGFRFPSASLERAPKLVKRRRIIGI
jgi:hypothetical protein